MKKFRKFLLKFFVVLMLVMVLVMGYTAWGIRGVRSDTQSFYSGFKVGAELYDFTLPDTDRLFFIFNGENRECLQVIVRADHLVATSHHKKYGALSRAGIGEFLRENFSDIAACDEMHVSLFDNSSPFRGSFRVFYSTDGVVTALEEPYFWD